MQLFTVKKINMSSAVSEMGERLATIVMGRKVGDAVPLSVEVGSWVPIYNTMWPGPRPTTDYTK